MAVGWGHALAAAVGGYMRGSQMTKDSEKEKNDLEFQNEQRGVWRQEQADKRAERDILQQAASPVEMFSGDQQALDTLTDKTAGPQQNVPMPDFNAPVAFQVGSQRFTDQAEAQKAVMAANTPEAQTARMAQGYRSLGQPEKALTLESSGRQAQMDQMKLADAEFRKQLGTAMAAGPEALADLITKNSGDRLGGATIKAVPSADGQTISFVSVDADGKATPFMGATNLPANSAVITLGSAIDRLVPSQDRLAMLNKQQESARQQANADRTFGLQEKQLEYQKTSGDRNFAMQQGAQDRQNRESDLRIKAGELAYEKAVREEKIPPAVKMQVDGFRKELDVIASAVTKAQADGSWNPESEGAKTLIKRQAVLTEKMSGALTPFLGKQEGSKGSPFGISSGGASFDSALKSEGVTDPKLASFIKSIHVQESDGGRNTRTSNAGAVGQMQILPGTFKEVADKGWNIENADHNARAGIRYAVKAWQAAGGDPVLAGAYYYGGPGGMAKAKRGEPVSDPKNPKAPNTIQYGQSVAARMGVTGGRDATAPQVDKLAPNRLYDTYLALARGARNIMPEADPALTARLNAGLEGN